LKGNKVSNKVSIVAAPMGTNATSVGIVLPDGMSQEEWIDAGKQLAKCGAALQWWVGDWLNYGTKQYGEIKSSAGSIGINYNTANQWARVAAEFEIGRRLPSVPFSHYHTAASHPDKKERNKLLAVTKEGKPKFTVREIKDAIREHKRLNRIRNIPTDGKQIEVHHCSVSELSDLVEPASVDVVITDPPYPKEFLGVYSDLSAFCANSLKPGGLLVCMIGQSYLPEVMQRLSENLTYHWCFAYLTPGGQSAQLWDRKVNTFWKPLLCFSNGDYSGERWFGDVLKSDPNDNDKQHHHWGQSESGMRAIVEAFSEEGELVCDPFFGGGTTAIVANALGRRFVGCDIDKACTEVGNVNADQSE
jgi:hypothetical protein